MLDVLHVQNITLHMSQNDETDILLGGVTWCQKQHSESINRAEIAEHNSFVCCKETVLQSVAGDAPKKKAIYRRQERVHN
jgi:hypothetical protein